MLLDQLQLLTNRHLVTVPVDGQLFYGCFICKAPVGTCVVWGTRGGVAGVVNPFSVEHLGIHNAISTRFEIAFLLTGSNLWDVKKELWWLSSSEPTSAYAPIKAHMSSCEDR